MSKTLRTTGRKFLSVFLSAATVFSLSGAMVLAPVASAAALTQSQVSAIISLLQSFGADAATIANVQASLTGGTPTGGTGTGTGTSTGNCGFTRDLTTGVTGNDVMCLQQYLNMKGFTVSATGAGSPGQESTYFGSKTAAATAKWQAANGITPSVGYFGSKSRAAYNTMVGTGTGT